MQPALCLQFFVYIQLMIVSEVKVKGVLALAFARAAMGAVLSWGLLPAGGAMEGG